MRVVPTHPGHPGDADFYSAQGPATVLSPDSCRDLLRRARLGRLAVCMDGTPVVFPVDYRYDRDQVVLRTASGQKLDALQGGTRVAFQVDHRDARVAWSVMAHGIPQVIDAQTEVDRLDRLRWPRWIPVSEYTYVAIPLQEISGRRIAAHVELARLVPDG